ncbi:MAG TPA: hypothetical protein VKP30_26420 [Polyangiaceae bacterium]|nr:hypothetical protein [Polyangiaceae bacterium]
MSVDYHGLLESFDRRVTDTTLHLAHVDLLDLALWVQQAHRKVAIVGQQKNAAGRVVEPPYRNQTRVQAADQGRYRGATFWIARGTHDTSRLVQ